MQDVGTPPSGAVGRLGGLFLFDLFAGILIGLLAALSSVSFAVVIYSGPLAPFLPLGARLALAGAAVVTFVAAVRPQYSGVLWQPQSIALIVLGKAILGLTVALSTEGENVLLASVLVLLMATTVLSGVVMLAIGFCRLGEIARSIPYPVIGGLFAAIGVLLMHNSLRIASSVEMAEPSWSTPFGTWMLPVAVGVGLALVSRAWSFMPTLPVGLLLYTAGAYLAVSFGAAAVTDLAIPAVLPADGTDALAVRLPNLLSADVAALADQLPQILAAAALSLIGVLVNASGIQAPSGSAQDMNKELRLAGITNVASGLAGGFPGYHSLTLTQLSGSLTQGSARGVAIVAFLVIVASLLLPSALAFVPAGVPALVLAYIGTGLLLTWVWDGWRRLPFKDYVLLLVILATALVFGIAAALVAGCLIAASGFTLAYAQIPPVRARLDGRQRSSSLERSEPDNRRLREVGEQTAIFELQGYLFFGTGNRIQKRILSDVAGQRIRPDYLVIDFRAVQGIDVSAAQVLGMLALQLRKAGISLYLSGMSGAALLVVRQRLEGTEATICGTLDEALTEVEGRILAAPPGTAVDPAVEVTALLKAADEAGLGEHFPRASVASGEIVMRQGDSARSIVVLQDGRLDALVRDQDGRPFRVAAFLPGAIVGEIGYCTGERRTAEVVARTPCRIRVVTREGIEKLTQADPAAALAFQQYLSTLLARRLIRTTSVLRALEG